MDITADLVEVVRKYTRAVRGDFPLDAELVSLGLDSMGAINLLMDLETAFEFTFPDELLNEATFKTTATLKSAIENLLNKAV